RRYACSNRSGRRSPPTATRPCSWAHSGDNKKSRNMRRLCHGTERAVGGNALRPTAHYSAARLAPHFYWSSFSLSFLASSAALVLGYFLTISSQISRALSVLPSSANPFADFSRIDAIRSVFSSSSSGGFVSFSLGSSLGSALVFSLGSALSLPADFFLSLFS